MLGEALFRYSGLSPSDPKVEPYLALAERLDLPLGVHMGLSFPDMSHDPASQYRVGLGSPLLLEAALLRHPKLRIFIMHAGWPFLDDAVAVMHAYPQVYVESITTNATVKATKLMVSPDEGTV